MVQCANFLIAKAAIGFLAHKMSQWSMLIVETGANPLSFHSNISQNSHGFCNNASHQSDTPFKLIYVSCYHSSIVGITPTNFVSY